LAPGSRSATTTNCHGYGDPLDLELAVAAVVQAFEPA
jgi:hypothetical protein